MNLFRSKNLEINCYSDDVVILTIYNHRLANKVNKALGGYYDATIKKLEEPIFLVNVKDIANLDNRKLKNLPNIHKIINSFSTLSNKQFKTFKICPKCNKNKPFTKYNINWSKNNGISTYCKSCLSVHRKENRAKYNAYSRDYSIRKFGASPKWLTKKQKQDILEFYNTANELSWLSIGGLHVDHIIPLKGKIICGLHVPWNLQILPAHDNISKSNKLVV